jgi:hypothetical protein
MPDDFIRIEVKGLKELQAAIAKFPQQSAKYLGQAGEEAAKRVLFTTEGLKKYPPAGAANAPPTPYYIRGRGTQYKSGNTGKSEKLGTQWYAKRQGYTTLVGNRASYAKWVHGDEDQASFMAPKGWRKLLEVAKEKMDDILKVYDAWVDKLLKDVGLK